MAYKQRKYNGYITYWCTVCRQYGRRPVGDAAKEYLQEWQNSHPKECGKHPELRLDSL